MYKRGVKMNEKLHQATHFLEQLFLTPQGAIAVGVIVIGILYFFTNRLGQ